jgi:RNA 2',3'-cyclic 3'-phosphodiesterase
MENEQSKSPRARLFVALELPEELRSGVEAWGREALADPALRPLPAESLHVTLAFLGYRPEEEVGSFAEIVEGLEGPPTRIALGEAVSRPGRGRPRLFALPIDSPGAVSLQATLEERLVEMGLHEPEERPFWPHLTVARGCVPRHGARGGHRRSPGGQGRSRRPSCGPAVASEWRSTVPNSSHRVRSTPRWRTSS